LAFTVSYILLHSLTETHYCNVTPLDVIHLRNFQFPCPEDKEQYHVKNYKNVDGTVDMNTASENIIENIKTSAKESLSNYELQQHKPWFDDECSKFIDREKQAILQWLQNPSQMNGDNMDNVRREASRTFRTKKGNI
jgi:hypothetical protein